MFAKDFSLGFSHSATDAWSDYAKYKIRITDLDLTEREKQIESASFILHRCRAHLFYEFLGRVEDYVTYVKLILPKTPIGRAYYS